MEIIRVGKKVISKDKIVNLISKVLKLRSNGSTQLEVAKNLGIERSFISHLEGVGEIRKGKKIAVVGFNIKNKDEIEKVALDSGVELIRLFGEKGKENLIKGENSEDILDSAFKVFAELANFDLIVFMASKKRVRKAEKIFGKRIYGFVEGRDKNTEEIFIHPEKFKALLEGITKKKKWRIFSEKSS